ncbi:MAG: translation initiation factor IF-2 [Candidatus Marinamargulisbacteria bacterium]
MKVKDLANEYGKQPKDFIKILLGFDIKVKSENTRLDNDTIETIKDLFEGDKDYIDQQIAESKKATFSDDQIKISDFAKLIDSPMKDIMGVVLKKGLLLNINSVIDASLAQDIASDLGIKLTLDNGDKTSPSTDLREQIEELSENQDKKDLRSRPPVITVMGHVDHGKTLLLDKIRASNVADSESGGITQHIGAYQVQLENKKKMTFLDTPGHEAFTALRSRGAQVTDIAILVIAADDGIKPQTIEAINHAKAADTPIIVAANKIDAPGADVERIKQQITEHELVPEEWGGNTILCPISAKTGEGIDNLLEMIQLTSDVLELKTTYDDLAKAVTIEAFLDKQRGPITSVLVKSGKLTVGSFVTIGGVTGKVRALYNDKGESVKEALPSTPVEVLGLSEVPTPGDILEQHETEQIARKIAEENLEKKKKQHKQSLNKSVSLDTLSQQINDGDVKTLNLIIKADVHGSLDALVLSINQLDVDDISINVMHSATGSVNENDILLAKAADAIVIGFRVQVTNDAKKASEEANIDIRSYKVIYDIISDIEDVMSGMYKKSMIETRIGEAEVREVFKFSKVGAIAGSYVTDGKLTRNSVVAVHRDKKELFKGKLSSLKRFKEDVKQVETGYECGIVIDGFSAFEAGDVIECFEISEG